MLVNATNKRLKVKAFQLLYDKLEKKEFEQDLYDFVQVCDLNNNKFIYDLVTINYRSEMYKKEVFSCLKQYCSEMEITSFSAYEQALAIIGSSNASYIFSVLDSFTDLYIKSEYSYATLSKYYFLREELSLIDDGYGERSEMEVLGEIKKYSRTVIDLFNSYKEKEDWKGFLLGSEEIVNSNTSEIEVQEMSAKEFVSSSLANLESKSRIEKLLGRAGYSNYEINAFFTNSKKETIKKYKEKALPLLVVGFSFSTPGILILSNGHTRIIYAWFLSFIGLACVYTSIRLYVKIMRS
jgi:hypothetical protein